MWSSNKLSFTTIFVDRDVIKTAETIFNTRIFQLFCLELKIYSMTMYYVWYKFSKGPLICSSGARHPEKLENSKNIACKNRYFLKFGKIGPYVLGFFQSNL